MRLNKKLVACLFLLVAASVKADDGIGQALTSPKNSYQSLSDP
ncbi:hypothetical protein [Pseudomonas sp. R3-57]